MSPEVKNIDVINFLYGEACVISPPSDLIDLLNQTAVIRRFVDNPIAGSEIIPDDVFQHTHRLQIHAHKFDLSNITKRMLWIHDIPEIVDGDVSAVLVQNELEGTETPGVLLLPPSDRERYTEFSKAKNVVRGLSDSAVSLDAIYAAVLDIFDGNLWFMYWVSNYCLDKPWVGKNLVETFNYVFLLDEYVKKMQDTVMSDIMSFRRKVLLSCWERVPSSNVPLGLSDFLSKIRSV